MNEKIPELSIITVCYNNINGLQKTVESVVNQTFTDYEYIIVDGGSTDGTVDLIRNYESKIKNLRWISEKDSGIYNAMNRGIEMSRGEYCYFLNSDDYLAAQDTLEKIFAKLKPETDIIYGNLAVRKGNKLHNVIKLSKKITPWSFYRFKTAIHHQASFIKRNLFEKYGNYDEEKTINADWYFFFQTIIVHRVKIQYVNRVFAVFLYGGKSSGSNPEAVQAVNNLKKETFAKYLSAGQLKKYEIRKKLTENLFITKINKLVYKLLLIKSKLINEL